GQAAVAVRNLNAGDGYTLIATVTMVGFGPASTASLSFHDSAPPLPFGNKGNLTDAFETVGYTDRLIAAGGKAPYNFKITDGALPSGMQLADDGSVTGSPTEVIFAVFTGNVTDSSVPPQSFSQQFGLQSWAQPSAFCAQGSFPIFNNWNTAAVSFNGTQPTITPKGFPNGYRLVAMATYHSSGARSGSIGLKEVVGETVTFPTTIVPSGTAGFDSWEATGIDFVLRDA